MDEPLIKVGHSINAEDAENLKDIIVQVFKAGFESHMDQSTIQSALSDAFNMLSAQSVTIQNCTLKGSTTINTTEE
jgi:regulator of RNase E activity RraB